LVIDIEGVVIVVSMC
jgi:hypothetical protein